MRDLTRPNALRPAYVRLAEAGFDVFTPLHWVLTQTSGKRQRRQVPVVHDLLFVRSEREALDPVVDATATLQYRYRRGGAYCEPLTVPTADMERFIRAVRSADATEVRYYTPDELTSSMIGREVTIHGGTLDGYRGRLLRLRGSNKRRLLVSLTGLLTAAVEVAAEYITIE